MKNFILILAILIAVVVANIIVFNMGKGIGSVPEQYRIGVPFDLEEEDVAEFKDAGLSIELDHLVFEMIVGDATEGRPAGSGAAVDLYVIKNGQKTKISLSIAPAGYEVQSQDKVDGYVITLLEVYEKISKVDDSIKYFAKLRVD
ncbi:MAG: hypothetical protein KKB81_07320 [Candidatus Margulisbacteria bacterium]|nr:hypothetical protein [Candidatus Margulisiibacteriota bacterium]MBU1021164.1 hypothetical protein [Candidatus Margulisiibacteriota bacterium]MBU1729770.1 hypothetical protein [Candidatus Margulisiibacteriota bacterium]MBU1955271.1 hypothetical protein [Candidatus Margulisiibacteriota bacterium]